MKLGQVVSNAAANVYEEGCLGALIGSGNQTLLDGIKGFGHPRRAALAVAAHVVVEVRAVAERLLPGKHVQLGLVGVHHGRVLCVGRVFEAALSCVLVELDGTAACARNHGQVAIANDGDAQRLAKVGRLVLVRVRLDDVAHGAEVAHQTALTIYMLV